MIDFEMIHFPEWIVFFRTFESRIFQTSDQTILLKLVSSLTSNDFYNCKINSKFYTLHTPSFSKNGQIFTILTLNQKCLFSWNVKIGGSNVFFSDLDIFKSLHIFLYFMKNGVTFQNKVVNFSDRIGLRSKLLFYR